MLPTSRNVSLNHPLRRLFSKLVSSQFQMSLLPVDPQVLEYVSNLLTEFVHMDNIYRLRDTRGRPLREVADMLLEGDVLVNATRFSREREVHRHIGDFTLFWTGVFPEALKDFRAPWKRDHLIDYMEQGKRSYFIASTFRHGDYARDAELLRQLSELFEFCAFGLNQVRREWERLGQSYTESARALLQ